jgi:hypothetical protein
MGKMGGGYAEVRVEGDRRGLLPRASRPFSLLILPFLVCSVPGPQTLAAQDSGPSPSRVLAAVGVAGSLDSLHGFAGGQVALGGQRFGVIGHGAYGSGNQFTSILIGVGPSARLALPASRTGVPLELKVFGGWGRYKESLAETSALSGAGESRDAWGPQAGVTLLTPLGPVRAGLGVMVWGGRFQAESMVKGVPARGSRFSLLVGR